MPISLRMSAGKHFLQLGGLPGPVPLAGLEADGSSSGTASRTRLGALATSSGAPFTLICHPGLPPGIQDWLTASMAGRAASTSGSVVSCNFNYEAVSALEFSGARVSQIRFPTADAASAEAGTLRIALSPASATWKAGDGGLIGSTVGTRSRKWMANNFRFEMSSLPTGSVDRVDGVTVNPPGAPEAFEIRLLAREAKPFADAARKGRVLPASLSFLDATLSRALLRLRFPAARVAAVTLESSTLDAQLSKARVRLSPGTAFLSWER